MAKRSRSPQFLTALRAARDALAAVGAPSAIIGGVAVIAQGVPRYTADIDASVAGAGLDPRAVIRRLARHGFVARIKNAARFAAAHQVLLMRHQESGVELDLSLAWLEFELEALRRAEPVDYAGVRIVSVRVEDLVIYKLIAHRPVDLADAERLLLLHGSKIDVARVRFVLGELAEALEGADRVSTLDTLLRRTGRARGGRRR